MKQKKHELDTTTCRKAHKVASVHSRKHKRGTCPRCGSNRPCFIRVAEWGKNLFN